MWLQDVSVPPRCKAADIVLFESRFGGIFIVFICVENITREYDSKHYQV